jgi:hypothetical protein
VLRFQIIKILQITVAILLAGRAWQHLFWDAPYEFLFTEKAGFSDLFVDRVRTAIGWFYLLGVVFCFTLDTRNSKWGYSFVVYSTSLLLLAQLYRVSNSNEIPTLLLYTSQFATPYLYYRLQFTKIQIGQIMTSLKLSLTITLGGYAWYAFGFVYGQKSDWLHGLAYIFGVNNVTASYILIGLGIFEILIVLVLWVKPVQKVGLAGILFWGVMLMSASVALFVLEKPHWMSGLRSAWELLCLIPNAGLSYAIWRYINEKKKEEYF